MTTTTNFAEPTTTEWNDIMMQPVATTQMVVVAIRPRTGDRLFRSTREGANGHYNYVVTNCERALSFTSNLDELARFAALGYKTA